jgi:signal transduction histidine kinase
MVGNETGQQDAEPSRDEHRQRLGDFYAALLAIASHDLRQPLQVIVGALELLGRRLAVGPEREQLERGSRASGQLIEQLDLLTEALHLHERTGGIHPQPVALPDVLGKIAQDHGEAARQKGLKLRVVPAGISVMSDPVLLGAILRNLVRNALKYTLPGGRVVVGCRRRGVVCRIEVHDTGVGIPPDHLAIVFDAFQRLDPLRSDGLGLGLFIVKRAAGSLGHRVEVRSVVGKGSSFAVVAEAARASSAEPSRALAVRPPEPPGREPILPRGGSLVLAHPSTASGRVLGDRPGPLCRARAAGALARKALSFEAGRA